MKADAGYPPDGISLLPTLTKKTSPVPRKLFWRFHANAQRAFREGDLKWLEIRDNIFLFNVVDDPLERANLKDRLPKDYQRMVAAYDAWNATMLPENPDGFSERITGKQWADHYGNAPD